MRHRDGAGRVLDYSYDAGGRLERVRAVADAVSLRDSPYRLKGLRCSRGLPATLSQGLAAA